MKKTTLAALTAAAALALPAAAGAHVTLQPRQAVAGSFSKLDVRVPNERDNKGTIKVDLRLPDGFYFLSYQKVPGWTARVYRRTLDRPVDLGGFAVDERYTRIVWRAKKPKRDRIAPGQFQDFPLSVRVPDGAAGTQLVSGVHTCSHDREDCGERRCNPFLRERGVTRPLFTGKL